MKSLTVWTRFIVYRGAKTRRLYQKMSDERKKSKSRDLSQKEERSALLRAVVST